MSRDPIEYRGGENLYAYVGGKPVGWVDPSGLAPLENAFSGAIRYKPEEGDARPPAYCNAGEKGCDVDAIFPDDPARRPIKIPDNCTAKLDGCGDLHVECGDYYGIPANILFKLFPSRRPHEMTEEELKDSSGKYRRDWQR